MYFFHNGQQSTIIWNVHRTIWKGNIFIGARSYWTITLVVWKYSSSHRFVIYAITSTVVKKLGENGALQFLKRVTYSTIIRRKMSDLHDNNETNMTRKLSQILQLKLHVPLLLAASLIALFLLYIFALFCRMFTWKKYQIKELEGKNLIFS